MSEVLIVLMVLQQTAVGFRTIDIRNESKTNKEASRFAAVLQDEGVFDIIMLGEHQLTKGAPLMCAADDMQMSLTIKGALHCVRGKVIASV